MCYGEFNRRYNKQYVQPIKQRVLRVLAHWVRDDPFNEMKQPIGGGTLLYRRIRSWVQGIFKFNFIVKVIVWKLWVRQKQCFKIP